jgi:hypothetical protein
LILPSKLVRSPPIAALTFALGTVMTPAAAQSPAEFYKGKTITIMLGHPPGGSYDLYARLAADYMRMRPSAPRISSRRRVARCRPTATAIAHAPSNVIEAATRAIAVEEGGQEVGAAPFVPPACGARSGTRTSKTGGA